MPALPSSLALVSIADGSAIIAADHRNNYAAIQTDTNALITALTGGTTGDVLGGVGTTLTYAKPPGYEYTRSTVTVSVTVSGTNVAQTTVIGPTTGVVFDGSTSVDVVFTCCQASTGNADSIICELYEDATSLGLIAVVSTNAAAVTNAAPIHAALRRTPSSASHTYTVKAYRTTNNGTLVAGAGGAATQVPIQLKVVKA